MRVTPQGLRRVDLQDRVAVERWPVPMLLDAEVFAGWRPLAEVEAAVLAAFLEVRCFGEAQAERDLCPLVSEYAYHFPAAVQTLWRVGAPRFDNFAWVAASEALESIAGALQLPDVREVLKEYLQTDPYLLHVSPSSGGVCPAPIPFGMPGSSYLPNAAAGAQQGRCWELAAPLAELGPVSFRIDWHGEITWGLQASFELRLAFRGYQEHPIGGRPREQWSVIVAVPEEPGPSHMYLREDGSFDSRNLTFTQHGTGTAFRLPASNCLSARVKILLVPRCEDRLAPAAPELSFDARPVPIRPAGEAAGKRKRDAEYGALPPAAPCYGK